MVDIVKAAFEWLQDSCNAFEHLSCKIRATLSLPHPTLVLALGTEGHGFDVTSMNDNEVVQRLMRVETIPGWDYTLDCKDNLVNIKDSPTRRPWTTCSTRLGSRRGQLMCAP